MNRNLKQLALAALLTLSPATGFAAQKPGDFTVGNKTFLLNGQPFIVKAAEVHYPRIPRPYWEHRIQMCKALGMNAVCIYIFWNIHEQREGEFTLRATTMWPSSADWHRRTASTSSCAPVPTSVPSGRWAVCPGGS